MAEKKTKTIEETFTHLESIIEALESGESSLEDSFQLFETGMKLVKSCTEKMDQVEKKIMVLQDGGQDGSV